MKYSYTLICLLLSLMSLNLCAQSTDSLRAESFLEKAKALKKNYQYEQSVNWYKKAIALHEKTLGKEHLRVGQAYNNLGNCYKELGEYDLAVESHKKGLAIKLCTAGDKENTTAISYMNLGVAYRFKNYLNKALNYYQKSLDIRKNLFDENSIKIANLYENIAICHEKKGDYDKAITYYEKSLPIQLEQLGEFDREIGFSYNNIAGCLTKQKKFSEALEYFDKALIVKEKNPNAALDPTTGDLYDNIGTCYHKNEQFDKAIKMFQKSLDIRKKTLPANHIRIGFSYNDLGDCYKDMEDYPTALVYYKKFLQLLLNKKQPSSIDLARAYTQLGEIYSLLGDYQQGLSFQDKAWTAFFADITSSNKKSVTQEQFDNQTEKALNNPLAYYDILSQKAQILWNSYKNTKDASYLFPALLSYRQAADFANQLRFSYTESHSKQLLLERVYEDYENAIATCYELYQKNNNTKFLYEAFDFAEKSKSVLLLESMNTTSAENFSGIPHSLLEKEKELQADIAHIEQRKFLALQEKNQTNSAKIRAFNDQLFSLKKEQESLIYQFETKYKKYYELKYDITTASVENLQQLLKPQQTMVSYFMGDSSLFSFVVSPTNLQFLKLEKDIPIQDLVSDVLTGLYNYQLDSIRNEQYVSAAHQLYQKLWENIIPDTAQEIIIIPNGELGILPFEVLLKTYPTDVKYFSTYDYLINDHQISYNYSATLFEKLSDTIALDKEYRLLAFAPTFDSSTSIALAGQAQRGFDQLKYNRTEVKNIQRILNVDEKVFLEQEATKANFLAHANDYNLIHLATHGNVNDNFGDYSYLAFAESNNQQDFENKLFVKDLYNISLQADMVVLSACETGLGNLQKGEGIMSLARGFFYAGAKSMVTTLWKVSDKSSAKIIKHFYKNLNNQMPKDAALRQAKLTYINNHPDKLAHPFYWAAYIPVGNMSTLNLSPSFSYWYIVLCASFFVVFIMGICHFRKI